MGLKFFATKGLILFIDNTLQYYKHHEWNLFCKHSDINAFIWLAIIDKYLMCGFIIRSRNFDIISYLFLQNMAKKIQTADLEHPKPPANHSFFIY